MAIATLNKFSKPPRALSPLLPRRDGWHHLQLFFCLDRPAGRPAVNGLSTCINTYLPSRE